MSAHQWETVLPVDMVAAAPIADSSGAPRAGGGRQSNGGMQKAAQNDADQIGKQTPGQENNSITDSGQKLNASETISGQPLPKRNAAAMRGAT